MSSLTRAMTPRKLRWLRLVARCPRCETPVALEVTAVTVLTMRRFGINTPIARKKCPNLACRHKMQITVREVDGSAAAA